MYVEPQKIEETKAISIEEIENGLMQMSVGKEIPEEVETKYSNLDVEFEQKVKAQSGLVLQDDDDDLFIITEDKEEEPHKSK